MAVWVGSVKNGRHRNCRPLRWSQWGIGRKMGLDMIHIDRLEYAQYDFQGNFHSLALNSGLKTSKSYFSNFSSHNLVETAGISTPKPFSKSSFCEFSLELDSGY